MNRYDGVGFLHCLTHTTTYCVPVLRQQFVVSVSEVRGQSSRPRQAAVGGGQFGAPPRLCPLPHTLPLCPGPNIPLFPREVTGQPPPSPPAPCHLD